MKKFFVLVALILPIGLMAQKPPKPSIPKAEKAMWEGKLDEAKQIIDVTVASEKFAENAKAWYVRGLIYASLDTTSNEQYKGLEKDPFKVAVAAFEKCNTLDNGKSGSFINGPDGFPLLESQINPNFAGRYFNRAVVLYQDEEEYKDALTYLEKAMYFLPNDSSVLLNAGVYFAPMAEDWDKTIKYINEYHELGGKTEESYLRLYSVYADIKKDTIMALNALKKAEKAHPKNVDFPKYELNLYISQKKYNEAKKMVEDAISLNPDDYESYYLLGQLHKELKEPMKAREAFLKAASLNPKNFEAAAELANSYWLDAKVIKDQMGALGNSKEDLAKMIKLDAQYVEKLKIYLPYIEKCEKIEPDNLNVLYPLLSVYQDLDNAPQVARVKKRLKALGEDI